MAYNEKRGSIRDRKFVWMGDLNNVLFSWVEAANIFNFSLEMPIVGFKTYLLELLKFSNPNPTPMNGENVSSKK